MTTYYKRLYNAAWWLNHDANLFQANDAKRRGVKRKQVIPCPKSAVLLKAMKNMVGFGPSEMARAEHEVTTLESCLCHPDLTSNRLLAMEFTEPPKPYSGIKTFAELRG